MNKKVLAGTLISVCWCLLIFLHIPGVKGSPLRQWPMYISDGLTVWFLLPLAIAGAIIFVWYQKKSIALVCVLWVLFVFALVSASPLGITKPAKVVYSPGSNSYFYVAAALEDPLQFVQKYHEIQPRLPLHASTHPPGPVLFYFAVNRLTANIPEQGLRSGFLMQEEFSVLLKGQLAGLYLSVFLMLGLASLSIYLAYLIALKLWGEDAAWKAVLVVSFFPAFALFAPEFDQVYLTLAFLVFYLWIQERELLAGLVLGLGSFMTFPFLILAPFTLVYSFFSKKLGSVKVMCFVAGVILFYIPFVFMGYHPVKAAMNTWSTSFEDYATSTRNVEYSYFSGHLFYNFYEIIVFSILPFVALLRKNKVVLSFAVCFIALVISGIIRYEIARLMLFMAGFLVLGVVKELEISKHQLVFLVLLNILIIFVSAHNLRLVDPSFQFLQ